MPKHTCTGTSQDETVRSVMMQDIVGDYTEPKNVPEWDWIERSACFAHTRNGSDGVCEFVLNLATSFHNIPAKLQGVIAQARNDGLSYLIVHQGT